MVKEKVIVESEPSENTRKYSPPARIFLAFLVYQLVTFVGIAPLALLVRGPYTELLSFLIRFLALFFYLGSIYLVQKNIDRKPWSYLGLSFNKKALIGFATSLTLTGIIMLSAALINYTFFPSGEIVTDGYTFSWWNLTQSLSAAFILQGIPEEVVFRGYMSQTLTKSTPVQRMWITSFVFMLLHWAFLFAYPINELPIQFFYPFIFGVLAFILMYLFKSTWAAVGVHGGIHVFRFLLGSIGYHENLMQITLISGIMLVVSILLFMFKREQFKPENNWFNRLR